MDEFPRVEAAFANADTSFLDALRAVHDARWLAQFAVVWLRDSRPWARGQLRTYLQQPLSEMGHQALVKHLFKGAEGAADDELMAWFLAAFDRLVRYERRRRWRWDARRGRVTSQVVLQLPSNITPRQAAPRTIRNVRSGSLIEVPLSTPVGARLFTRHTRYYLRRRVWRYFRRMAFQRPQHYPAAISAALTCFTDEDLAHGEDLLESWGLVHTCFGEHPALTCDATRFRLQPGQTLQELSPAPCFPELWDSDEGFAALCQLVTAAESRLVRVWAIQMLERSHAEALRRDPWERFELLLSSGSQDLIEFVARWLHRLQALSDVPLSRWLTLLETAPPTVVASLSIALPSILQRDRLALDDCLALACSTPAPISQFGFECLQDNPPKIGAAALARLAECPCAYTASDLTRWALNQLTGPNAAPFLAAFLAAALPEARVAAFEWWQASRWANDPAVWTRALSTPHHELQLLIVDEIQRHGLPSHVDPMAAFPVWRGVLMNVQRGNRQQRKVIEQLRDALDAHPQHVGLLWPLLVLAARSPRAPEQRAAISAMTWLAERHPEWLPRAGGLAPEVQFS